MPNEALITLRKVFWRSREGQSRALCSIQLARNQISTNYITACCCASSVTSPEERGSGVTRWHSSDTFTDHYPALMSSRRALGWGNEGVSEHHSAVCDLWVCELLVGSRRVKDPSWAVSAGLEVNSTELSALQKWCLNLNAAARQKGENRHKALAVYVSQLIKVALLGH